jgi:hypothetical protein
MEIFCRHFHAHPLIPDRDGTFKTSEAIHRDCVAEMYRVRGYYRLWSYLFVNPGQWELWARSANPLEILVLKTTMIVESHWRVLKHDYLRRFNRPRIDLMIWVLIKCEIPDACNRLEAIQRGEFRKYKISWREPFKKQWKEKANEVVDGERIKKYHTDPNMWVCGCDALLISQFLVCKHLIHCCEPIANPGRFFEQIQRRRSTPFWSDNELILRREYDHRGKAVLIK